jgi:hypothetical protein
MVSARFCSDGFLFVGNKRESNEKKEVMEEKYLRKS